MEMLLWLRDVTRRATSRKLRTLVLWFNGASHVMERGVRLFSDDPDYDPAPLGNESSSISRVYDSDFERWVNEEQLEARIMELDQRTDEGRAP